MKNRLKTILALTLSILMCLMFLSSCGGEGDNKDNEDNDEVSRIKITETEIKSKLSEEEGTLTIEGSSDDVTSFKYVVTGINASKLIDKSYTRKAINTLLTDSSKITYGELQVSNAFTATASVVGLVNRDEGNFNADAFIEEMLNIICDGSVKTYGEWEVSATINIDANSITIVATCK